MPIVQGGDKWLEEFIPYLMYRITNHLNQRLRSRLRKEKINISCWRVLAVLHAKGDLNLGEIIESTVMEQPSVSRIVAQLEQDGFVKRKVSRSDSRFVNVTLTAAGEKAFQSIYPAAVVHQDKALRGFSRSEKNALISYLRRIQANVESEE